MGDGIVWGLLGAGAVVGGILAKRTKKQAAEVHLKVESKVVPTFTPDKEDNTEPEDRDAWEGTFYDGEDPKSLSAHFQIDYVDGDGNATSRSVRVRKFDHGLYGGMIMGHCGLRDETRTFRYDRIQSCVDIDTGEVVSDIREFLTGKYEGSLEFTLEKLLDKYLDVLKVIFYVARADGAFRKPEKEVACDYLKKLTVDGRLTVDSVSAVFSEIEVPSLHAFKLAVGRIVKAGNIDVEHLATCCKDMVNTQKTVSAGEQEALDYLEKKIR